VDSLAELNAQLLRDSIDRAKQTSHPEHAELSVWEMFERERPFLTRSQGPFTGFREKTVAVSRTCLISFDRNKYSVEARAVGRPAQVEAYATRIVIRQDGEIVGEHERSFSRGQTVFNPWHYAPVLQRKPPLAHASMRCQATGRPEEWRAFQRLGPAASDGADLEAPGGCLGR